MKKVSKILAFAVLTLGLVSAFAFRPLTTTTKSVKTLTGDAFSYIDAGGDEFDASNYVEYTGALPPSTTTCPTPLVKTCVIYDPAGTLATLGSGAVHNRILATKADHSKNGVPDPTTGVIIWLFNGQ